MSNVQIEVKAGLGSVNIFYNIVKYVKLASPGYLIYGNIMYNELNKKEFSIFYQMLIYLNSKCI